MHNCSLCGNQISGNVVRVSLESCEEHWVHPSCLRGYPGASLYICPCCNGSSHEVLFGCVVTVLVKGFFDAKPLQLETGEVCFVEPHINVANVAQSNVVWGVKATVNDDGSGSNMDAFGADVSADNGVASEDNIVRDRALRGVEESNSSVSPTRVCESGLFTLPNETQDQEEVCPVETEKEQTLPVPSTGDNADVNKIQPDAIKNSLQQLKGFNNQSKLSRKRRVRDCSGQVRVENEYRYSKKHIKEVRSKFPGRDLSSSWGQPRIGYHGHGDLTAENRSGRMYSKHDFDSLPESRELSPGLLRSRYEMGLGVSLYPGPDAYLRPQLCPSGFYPFYPNIDRQVELDTYGNRDGYHRANFSIRENLDRVQRSRSPARIYSRHDERTGIIQNGKYATLGMTCHTQRNTVQKSSSEDTSAASEMDTDSDESRRKESTSDGSDYDGIEMQSDSPYSTPCLGRTSKQPKTSAESDFRPSHHQVHLNTSTTRNKPNPDRKRITGVKQDRIVKNPQIDKTQERSNTGQHDINVVRGQNLPHVRQTIASKTGRKEHICDVCGRKFSTRKRKFRCKESHNNDAFKCDVRGCNSSFNRRDNLNTHKKTKH